MLRIARAVRAIQQQQLAGERNPLTPTVSGTGRTQNSLQLSWTLTEALKKSHEANKAGVTSVLQVCDTEIDQWTTVYRGCECKCTVDDLAPSTLYLFRLKVFEADGDEAASKWSEPVSGQTRDEPPSVGSLHRAIEFGNHQEAQRILQTIPIAACSCYSEAGLTCLQTAVAHSDLKMVKLLLQHEDVDRQSLGDGRTALMMASAKGRIEVVKMLLEQGAHLELADRNGLTALHHSVLVDAGIARTLLDAGAEVDAADCCGWTALMRAVLFGASAAVVELLLRRGASVERRDADGLSCLGGAVFAQRHHNVALLCAAGADVTAPADAQGHSALQLAAFDPNLIAILAPVVPSVSCAPVVRVRVDSQEEEQSTGND